MTLPTALEPKRLTPTEQKTIEMADAICGSLLRNPWDDPGLLDLADRRISVVDELNQHRRATDEAGR